MPMAMVETCEPGRWAAVAGALDEVACDRLIELCRTFAPTRPQVVGQEALADHRVGDVRRIERTAATEGVYDLVWELGTLLNERYFGLDLTGVVKAPEYVEYPAGRGHFHWHNDYGLERPTSRRKLTLSVQLSEADDYEGGDFEVFEVAEPLRRGRGTVIALPAYVHHRVTPVTRGRRRALVAWIAGPPLR